MKQKNIVLGLCFFTAILFTAISLLAHAAEINFETKKVEYALPYTGILPDNPVYPFKRVRDTLLIFFTRDYLKKAQLYLLFSDKKAAMAQALSTKAKWQPTTQIMQEAEQNGLSAVDAVKKSKKIGASPPADFIRKIVLSNQKHREIIQNLLKDAPEGERKSLEQAFSINKAVQKSITSL